MALTDVVTAMDLGDTLPESLGLQKEGAEWTLYLTRERKPIAKAPHLAQLLADNEEMILKTRNEEALAGLFRDPATITSEEKLEVFDKLFDWAVTTFKEAVLESKFATKEQRDEKLRELMSLAVAPQYKDKFWDIYISGIEGMYPKPFRLAKPAEVEEFVPGTSNKSSKVSK